MGTYPPLQEHMWNQLISIRIVGGAYDWGGAKKNFSPEPFIGGIKEGYAPLENDMVDQCLFAGTKGGAYIDGIEPTGDFLVQNRKKEKAAFAKLQSMQRQVKNSINKMQSDNLPRRFFI